MTVQRSKQSYRFVKGLFRKKIKIPETWDFKKIIDLGNIVTGSTPSTSNSIYFDGDYYWATPSDLTKKKWVKQTNTTLSQQGFDLCRQVPEKSILVTCIGSTGKIGMAFQNMATNQQINSIVCEHDNPNFVYYQLLQNSYLIKNLANQAVVPILNKTEFGNIKISLPKDINEQQKIASILSNVDALIENTQKIIDTTELLKKGLMQQLLTRGIGHTKFKKVKWMFRKEIEIPEEWRVKKIDELFEFLSTGTNPRSDLGKNGDIFYIHYGDIHSKWKSILDCNIEDIPLIEQCKVKKLSLLQEGDLIIADVSEDYEGSGTSILLRNIKNKKIVSGLHTFALRNNDKNIALYFRRYLTSINFVKIQIIAYVTGISVYGLSKKNFKKIKIPLPPLLEQQKIASILSGIDAYIQQNQQYKEKLKNLKKGLMQNLLTGKIRVKV